MMIKQQGYEFSEEAKEAMRDYIERRVDQPRFAHGRSIRNAIERGRMRQAMRLFEADRPLSRDELILIEATGLEARVIQHEMDHLDGILILERTSRDQRKEAMRTLRERLEAA